MPLEEFRETCIKLIQTEFLAERTKRRDMLEKHVERMTGNKPYQEEDYIPDREFVLDLMKSIDRPTETYLNNISDRI